MLRCQFSKQVSSVTRNQNSLNKIFAIPTFSFCNCSMVFGYYFFFAFPTCDYTRRELQQVLISLLISHGFIYAHLSRSLSDFFVFFLFLPGGMDKIRHESNPGHSHPYGGPESAAVGHAQRTQYLEVAHLARPAQRFRKLHVPSQHGSDAASGGWTLF